MASLSYCAASKLEPNIQEFNSELHPELLFDFNYDFEQFFYAENPDQAFYFDPFFDPDEFILPPEKSPNDSCFIPEYSDFESNPKRQKVVFHQDNNCLPDTHHNSCFIPDYSVFESNPKRQKTYHQDNNCLPNNTITDYSVFENNPKRQKVIHQDNNCLPNNTITEYSVFENNPKRQRVFHKDTNSLPPPHSLFNEGFVPNPPIFQDFASYSLPEIPMPVFSSSNNGAAATAKKGVSNNNNNKNNEKKMSAQSIAARQRRKKITEKTQELGKLIPGGHRMNTAEMLQATFKYIKFLQAQAGLLEFMASHNKGNEKSFETTDLQKLVGFSLIQEKLYSSEKCLVPKVFLEELENNQEFQNSKGLEEVKSLIR